MPAHKRAPGRAALVTMLESMTQRQVAAQCGVSRTTITRWLRTYGIVDRRRVRGKLSDEDVREIRRTFATLMERYDVSFAALCDCQRGRTYKYVK